MVATPPPMPMIEHGLAGAHPGPAHERAVGREAGERQRGRLLPREPAGLREDVLGRHQQQLRVGPVVGAAEDAEAGGGRVLAAAPAERGEGDDLVALGQAGDALAERAHGAGAVRARDHREGARGDALAHEDVAPVERRRAEGDEHLAGAGDGIGGAAHRQHLGATGLAQDDGVHPLPTSHRGRRQPTSAPGPAPALRSRMASSPGGARRGRCGRRRAPTRRAGRRGRRRGARRGVTAAPSPMPAAYATRGP